MSDFFAPLQVGIAFAGGCELDVLPTRLQLNETDNGLFNPQLQECLQCRELSLVMEVWTRIFLEATPFLFAMYAEAPESLAQGADWTSPLSLKVWRVVQQGDPLGPSLFASALQVVLLAANRQARALTPPVQIRAYMDDVSLTGLAEGLEYVLQDLGQLATEITLDLHHHKCGWWPGANDTRSSQLQPLLHSVIRPEGLSLLAVPFGDSSFMDTEVQRLVAKEELIQEELVKLAVTDPHTATILLRFCVGPRLTYWLRTLPLHWGALLADLNDKLTLRTVERLVHGFSLQSSAELRQHIHS